MRPRGRRVVLARLIRRLSVHVILPVHVSCISSASDASAFSSCPPPRFDTFSETIVGKWQYGPSLPEQAGEVQEVMRSCGGAVQGITEIVLPYHDNNDGGGTDQDEDSVAQGRYHNRADDGFIYFDCGCCSAGPVHLSNDSTVELLSSLSFPSVPNRRLLISAKGQVKSDGATSPSLDLVLSKDDSMTIGLNRIPFRATEDEEATGGTSFGQLGTEPESTILWRKESVCRMPSSTQPWMLQRAKWECFVSEDSDTDNTGGEGLGDKPNRHQMEGWIIIKGDDSDTATNIKLERSSDLDFMGPSKGSGGILVQIGALCRVTNRARAIGRSYDAQGKLCGVILQEGILKK